MRVLNLLFTSVLELSLSTGLVVGGFPGPFPRFRQNRLAPLALPALDSAGPSAAAAVLPARPGRPGSPLPAHPGGLRTGCFHPLRTCQ